MKKAEYLYDLIRTGIGDNEKQTQEFIKNFDISSCSFITEFNQSLLQKSLSHSSKYSIAKFLIEQSCNLNHQDNDGFTALMYLLDYYNGEDDVLNDEMTRLIIEKGADINVIDKYGNQALWYALINAKVPLEIIELLLEKGADPYHKNNVNKSVLDVVKEYDIDEITNIFNK